MRFGRNQPWLVVGFVLVGLTAAALAAGFSAWVHLARMRGAMFAARAEVDAAGRVRTALVSNLIDASRVFACPDASAVTRLEEALRDARGPSAAVDGALDGAEISWRHEGMNQALRSFWSVLERSGWSQASLLRQDFESRLDTSSVRLGERLERLATLGSQYREAAERFPGSWVVALTRDVPFARLGRPDSPRAPTPKPRPTS